MSLKLNRSKFGDDANLGNVLSKPQAEQLLDEWVPNDRLKLHMKQVGYLMRCWALEVEGLDEVEAWKWELAGLLHDADWEKWPELHCSKIIEELEQRSVDPYIIRAIASHGPSHFGVEPETKMEKMLYAFDELSGLIHAYSLMRPGGYEAMDVKGVQKRLKEKSFAANVSRSDIDDACHRAGLELKELIAFVISRQAKVGLQQDG